MSLSSSNSQLHCPELIPSADCAKLVELFDDVHTVLPLDRELYKPFVLGSNVAEGPSDDDDVASSASDMCATMSPGTPSLDM